MANELNIQLDPFTETGLTLLGKVYNKAGIQQGSNVSMTDTNGVALYTGTYSLAGLSDGEYIVRFETNTPDKLYGIGSLFVKDNAEVRFDTLVDDVWDELVTGHNLSQTFGRYIRQIVQGMISTEGAVNDVSATSSGFVSDLTSAVTDFYAEKSLVFISGNLTGQSRVVSSYNGTTKAFTFDEAFTSAPADTDLFIILTPHIHSIAEISTGVRAEMDSNSTQLAAIVTDTSEIGVAGAGLTSVPWNASWDAEVQSEVNDGLAAYNAVSTTNLPTNFADLAITATTGLVSVGANNDKTGYSISGSVTTLDGLNDPSAAAIADAVWDEAITGHNTAQTFGRYLRQINEGIISVEGAVNDVSATTTSFVSDLTEATDDHYNEKSLVFISGALLGQARVITDYNGTTKAITFDEAFTEAPADSDSFIILSPHIHSTGEIATAVTADMDANSTQLAAIVTDTNELQTDLTDGGRLDLLIDAILTDTGTTLPAQISALNNLSQADIRTAVGLAAANLDAQLAAIVTDTNELQTDLTDGGRLDLLIDQILNDTAVSIPNQITALNDLNAAEIRAAVGLAAANLDTQLSAIVTDTNILQIDWANGGRLDNIIDAILTDTGTTLPAQISALNNPSTADIADAVLDEAMSGHQTAGTLGRSISLLGVVNSETTLTGVPTANTLTLATGSAVDDYYNGMQVVFADGNAAGLARTISDYVGATKTVILTDDLPAVPTAGDAVIIKSDHGYTKAETATAVTADMDANSTQLAAIVGDTNELQTDLTDGGRLDLLIDAILEDTGTTLNGLLTGLNDLDAAGIRAAIGLAAANLDTQLTAIVGDTNELQTDLTDGGRLDLLIDAIKAKTDSLTFTTANKLDSRVDNWAGQAVTLSATSLKPEVDIASIADSATAASNLSASAGTIVTGAAIAGTLSTTQMTTDLAESTDDHYNGRIIIWTTGVLAGQATDITDYVGATRLLTYTATTEAPTATDEFVIV